MAYGTVEEVAGLARIWTSNGVFDAGTNPKVSQVTAWLDEVSATMDVALAGAGFTVPITQDTAVKSIGLIVESLVADLCHAANSSGRFFTDRAVERGVSPMMAVRRDISNWVEENADGLQKLGVPRVVNEGLGAFSVPVGRTP